MPADPANDALAEAEEALKQMDADLASMIEWCDKPGARPDAHIKGRALQTQMEARTALSSLRRAREIAWLQPNAGAMLDVVEAAHDYMTAEKSEEHMAAHYRLRDALAALAHAPREEDARG